MGKVGSGVEDHVVLHLCSDLEQVAYGHVQFDKNSTVFLENLFQCLTTFTENKIKFYFKGEFLVF